MDQGRKGIDMSKLTKNLMHQSKAHPLDVDLDMFIVAAERIETLEDMLKIALAAIMEDGEYYYGNKLKRFMENCID